MKNAKFKIQNDILHYSICISFVPFVSSVVSNPFAER